MAKPDELKDRLEELFSPPVEAEPPAPSDEPGSMGVRVEAAPPQTAGEGRPAADQTPAASAPGSGVTEVPGSLAPSPATAVSEANAEAEKTSPAVQRAEQSSAPAVLSPPPRLAAWNKEAGKSAPPVRFALGMLSNRSLRFRIISAFLIVTIVAVGGVTFFSDRTVRTRLTQDAGQSLKSLAVSTAQEVGGLLIKQVALLKSFALNEALHAGVDAANAAHVGDPAAIQAELEKLDQQWRDADATGNDADPLVQARLNNPMASALRRFRDSFPDHVEVFVTDQYGALLASTNRTSDYYQADEEWWQAAYNGGQGDVYIGQPEFDESSATFSVNMAVPLNAPDTQSVVGILRTTVDIGALQRILAQTGRSDLLLPSGEMIRSEGGFGPSEPETLSRLQSSAFADYVEFVYEDEPSLVSQAPVTSPDPAEAAIVAGLQWTAIVARDSTIVLAPVSAAAQAALFTGAGTFLVAALLALGLAQILVRPIARLTAVARKVAEGDLGVQAQVESGDEIGTLAATFNLMTAQLRETLQGHEARVAARTRDLELAAEVGRSLSQERSLDTLLARAVELIHARFDLYYTQIYLADAAGRSLALHAGAGEVGKELMRRAHRLPIGPGSINGRAASERRAVIVADTAASGSFKSNPLLPDTRSEMAVPLMIGEHVVGVLDLQSARPGALSAEHLPAFEALAGQLAIAVQNAALFAEAGQARAEVEMQARSLTRSGWQEFLNAVDRSERLGYTYEPQGLPPLNEPTSPAADVSTLEAPITLLGQPVGAIQLEREADVDQAWTQDDAQLVDAVAARVALQVESLRLLAQAEQYRAEAEAATRRLTREGWESYLATLAAPDALRGYVYDLNQVAPLTPAHSARGQAPANSERGQAPANGERGQAPGGGWQMVEPNGNGGVSFARPLQVRHETIGELAIDGVGSLPEEASELLATVTERLSAHVENLRLTEQTQAALVELQAAVARLRELDHLKSTFLANMSHELRTPLNSILGFADVILEGLDGPLTDNMENDLKLISRNGQHLLSLINDVLDMAKIEAGKMNLSVERVHLGEVLAEVLDITGPLAREKALDLRLEDGSADGLELHVDRIRLRQVMINLVGNAVKFTESGGIVIRAARDNGLIRISVHDTGPGIRPEEMPIIFEEFGQVDASTTRKAGGTGLGLPISKRLVEMHGGRLWAESSGLPGEGSTFIIELPASDAPSTPAKS